MNFKELAKVANKLDSLGLTKEADILDNYINKASRFSQNALSKKAGPDYVGIFSAQILGAFENPTKENENFAKDAAITIESNMTDIMKGIETVEGLVGANTGFYNSWVGSGSMSGINKGKYNSALMGINTVIHSQKKEDAPVAQVSETTYAPKPANKPAPKARGVSSAAKDWDDYTAKLGVSGQTIRSAWNHLSIVDESAGKRDNSFESYKDWYKEMKNGEWGGKDKSPTEVLAAIHNYIDRSQFWNGRGGLVP